MPEENVEVYIREDMDVTQRGWLVMKLEHEQGIVGAWFLGGDQHRLTVYYEREHFSNLTLLDTIRQLGFHGELLRSG
ncbi:MAG: hypothetical protein R6X06_11605 [Gammaproteobacteria bacterium]